MESAPSGWYRRRHRLEQFALERATAMMMHMVAEDVGTFDISAPVVARVGQRPMLVLTAALNGKPPQPRPIREQLASAAASEVRRP